jgi:hypothetical protein
VHDSTVQGFKCRVRLEVASDAACPGATGARVCTSVINLKFDSYPTPTITGTPAKLAANRSYSMPSLGISSTAAFQYSPSRSSSSSKPSAMASNCLVKMRMASRGAFGKSLPNRILPLPANSLNAFIGAGLEDSAVSYQKHCLANCRISSVEAPVETGVCGSITAARWMR